MAKQKVKEYLEVMDYAASLNLEGDERSAAIMIIAFTFGKKLDDVNGRLIATEFKNESLKTIQKESRRE